MMTEKEFYPKALKDRLSLPSEQTAQQILSGRRRYGTIRSKMPLLAVTAALSITAAVGAFVFALNNRTKADKAQDIVSQSPALSQSETEPRLANDEEQEYITRFYSAPDRCILFSYSNMLEPQEEIRFQNSLQLEAPYGAEQVKALAGYLLNSRLEYIGSYDELGKAKLLIDGNTSEGIGLYTPYGGEILLAVEDGNIFVELEPDNGKESFFRIKGAEGCPLYSDGRLAISGYRSSFAHYDCYGDAAELLKAGQSDTHTFSDTEGRISLDFSLDMSGRLPVVNISNIRLPEGESYTKSELKLSLRTKSGSISEALTFPLEEGSFGFEGLNSSPSAEEVTYISAELCFTTESGQNIIVEVDHHLKQ